MVIVSMFMVFEEGNMKSLTFALITSIAAVAQPVPDPPLKARYTSVWMDSTTVLELQEYTKGRPPGRIRTLSQKDRALPDIPIREKATVADRMLPGTMNVPGGAVHYLHTSLVELPSTSKSGKKGMNVDIFRLDDRQWKWEDRPCGRLASSDYFVCHLLSEHCLLGIASTPNTFEKNGQYFPFAVFKRDSSGTFILDHFESGGMKVPLIRKGEWSHPALANFWLQSYALWSRSSTSILCGAGLIWTFSPSGELISQVNLFSKNGQLGPLREAPWVGAVLGSQMNREGRIIISALSREASLHGPSHTSGLVRQTSVEGYESEVRKAVGEICSRWPQVEWWEVNPSQGSKRRLEPPRNIPALVSDFDEYLQFNWTFLPDGNIEMK